MRYFVRSNERIDGPFSIDEINARIAAKALGTDSLARSALGETMDEVVKAPKSDWLSWSCFALTPLAKMMRFGMTSRSECARWSGGHRSYHQRVGCQRSGIMNEWAAAVNTPVAPWFHGGHPRRRVTEQRR